jgi:hypothetical protein
MTMDGHDADVEPKGYPAKANASSTGGFDRPTL